MGLKRGIASFEWGCAYERVKEGKKKKATDRLFTRVRIGRQEDSSSCSLHSLSLSTPAFVIFSAEKKRKEKGEKRRKK